MESKLWKEQAPPPKQRTHKANSVKSKSERKKRTRVKYFCPQVTLFICQMTFERCFYVCPPVISLTEHVCCGPQTLLQLPKSTSKSMHLTNLPTPRELRLGLSCSYIETFIHHRHSSDVTGNYPVSRTKGANLSMLAVCSPGPRGDPAWPRYRLAQAARCLLSKTHTFRSVDLFRPAPASRVVSLQAEIKIPL